MLPTSVSFLKKSDMMGVSLLRTIDMASTTYNVSSISEYSKQDPFALKSPFAKTVQPQALVTVSTSIAGIEAGMKLTLSGTTIDGTYEITYIDNANTQFVISVPKVVAQASAAGTAVTSGTINIQSNSGTDTEIRNNDGEVLFHQYSMAGVFLYKKEDKNGIVNITVTNTDSSNAITGVTVKFSLDGVHWVDFPTALSSGSIAAGNSYTFLIGYPMQCYLRTDVTSGSATYYVVAR